MIIVNKEGHIIDPNINLRIFRLIEHSDMSAVHGIIVHQTDGANAQSAFAQYQKGGAGAHFLIDKDGTVYQTASIFKTTWNVGKLKARCLAEHRCTPAEFSKIKKSTPGTISHAEEGKPYPDRYPSNRDSIGIEIVGRAFPLGRDIKADKKTYEHVTAEQNASLKWLVQVLSEYLKVPMTEVFRHPVVSWKNVSEASTAQW